METKAFINFKENTVVLTGSDDFILQYLDSFRESLIKIIPDQISVPENDLNVKKSLEPKKITELKKEAEPLLTKKTKVPEPVDEKIDIVIAGDKPRVKLTTRKTTKNKDLNIQEISNLKKTQIKKILNLKQISYDGSFDIFDDKINPSLVSFLKEKNPNKNALQMVTAIAYYITKIKDKESFSDKNIEFAYDILPIPNKPKSIYYVIIDCFRKKGYIEHAQRGFWKLTRRGESFVENELPSK
jgi:hypothetical protein